MLLDEIGQCRICGLLIGTFEKNEILLPLIEVQLQTSKVLGTHTKAM